MIAVEQMNASITKTLREKSPSGPWVRATKPIAAIPETATAAPARSASRELAYRETLEYRPSAISAI